MLASVTCLSRLLSDWGYSSLATTALNLGTLEARSGFTMRSPEYEILYIRPSYYRNATDVSPAKLEYKQNFPAKCYLRLSDQATVNPV